VRPSGLKATELTSPGVVEKLAVQDLERHGAISHPDLLGEEDRTHAARAQAADKAKTAGQSGGKLRLGCRGLGGERSAVAGTELNVVEGTAFHGINRGKYADKWDRSS